MISRISSPASLTLPILPAGISSSSSLSSSAEKQAFISVSMTPKGGADLMGPAREGGEHGKGVHLVPRLPQPQALQKHHGIGGNNHRFGVARQGTGGLALFPADGGDDLLRREGGVEGFVRLRDEDLKALYADLA